jgi:hypothetical protein
MADIETVSIPVETVNLLLAALVRLPYAEVSDMVKALKDAGDASFAHQTMDGGNVKDLKVPIPAFVAAVNHVSKTLAGARNA